MIVDLQLTPEEIAEAADKAVARLLGGRLARTALVTTGRAAELLSVSAPTFLSLAKAAGIRPVSLGPRMTRWLLADLETLIHPE